jgi:hypothetical protein
LTERAEQLRTLLLEEEETLVVEISHRFHEADLNSAREYVNRIFPSENKTTSSEEMSQSPDSS